MRADARRNRARILQAARELFASEDSEVQMDDIARRAGVGVGTVYRHFPDKEALMGELVRERFGAFNERLAEAVADERSDPFEALAGALRANAASVAEDAATRYAFMREGEHVFAHAAAEMERFMALSTLLVERARRAGELAADFEAHDIPMLMCGVCAAIDKRKDGWDWRRHLELVLRGMRAR
ncbi:MAG TPA: helix-turn-helix domain-containing protein [Solirubrobacteraceae bacterium]|jgi:AcrR family transcriptional regulator